MTKLPDELLKITIGITRRMVSADPSIALLYLRHQLHRSARPIANLKDVTA
jgi:hypothetical protein